jgi:hypothetical protein
VVKDKIIRHCDNLPGRASTYISRDGCVTACNFAKIGYKAAIISPPAAVFAVFFKVVNFFLFWEIGYLTEV